MASSGIRRAMRGVWAFAGMCVAAAMSGVAAYAADEATVQQHRAVVAKGVDFLKANQAADGSWTSPDTPGISALALHGLIASGTPADDPAVKKGLAYLLSFAQPDGGIYSPKTYHSNYETAICVMVLSGANRNGAYDEILAKAQKFLRGKQWDESESIDSSDVKFGGAGYGKAGDRPDLSNTLFLLEALAATGAGKDDPAVQRALTFISRCQNLESEHNTTPFPAKVNDGGFYYTPAAGGSSQAGNTPEGGLRSYGSMTYAGLKSMIYAGVSHDDPRVKAAVAWLRKFYSLRENPGMGEQGLYYYYHTFAKALATLGEAKFVDADGEAHDWRKELVAALAEQQKSNGSWINANSRWYEGDPNLATAYALMALAAAKP